MPKDIIGEYKRITVSTPYKGYVLKGTQKFYVLSKIGHVAYWIEKDGDIRYVNNTSCSGIHGKLTKKWLKEELDRIIRYDIEI